MATIYVATNGNDTNPGTPDAAKLTIAGGLAAASPGDTVMVRDGSYPGGLVIDRGGTAADGPITLRAETATGASIVSTADVAVRILADHVRLQQFVVTGSSCRVGIQIAADHVEVAHNWVHHLCEIVPFTFGGGIVAAEEHCAAVTIRGNRVTRLGQAGDASGRVRAISLASKATGGQVINNLVHAVVGAGIWASADATGWRYVNNTVVDCTDAGITPSAFGVVRNNIVYGCAANYRTVLGALFSANLSAFSADPSGDMIPGVTAADPRFTDYATATFTLAADSPAIDAADTVDAPTDDLTGAARPQGGGIDIGAYEAAVATLAASGPVWPLAFGDGVPYPVIPLGGATVAVSSSAALSNALAGASPGQRIVLAGSPGSPITYSGNWTISKTGSGNAGISIEAATTGGARFAAGSTFLLDDAAYVTLKGLSFPYELSSAANVIAVRGTSHHCRVTRCRFGPAAVGTPGTEKTPYVFIGDRAEFIRVDHNEVANKANPGNAFVVDGDRTVSPEQVCQHIRIDHNYLHDIRPEVPNEKEPIRFGWSGQSKSHSHSVVERNVFVACICEPEVISVKASSVRVTGNVVYRCIGGPVYRHGTDGVLADNYVIDGADTFGDTIGSGGFRAYDARHNISFNYIFGVYGGNFQGPLLLDTGDAEGSSTNLTAHWRVVDARVEKNVIVDCPEGIRIGDNYSSAPTGCVINDNLVAQVDTGVAITQRIAPVNTTITPNPHPYYATPGAAGMTQDGAGIWRKAGFGPRLTYLVPADVGVTGDPDDTDGTGATVAAGGGGGGADHVRAGLGVPAATARGASLVGRAPGSQLGPLAVRELVANPDGLETVALTTGAATATGDVLVAVLHQAWREPTDLVAPTGDDWSPIITSGQGGSSGNQVGAWYRHVTAGGPQTVSAAPPSQAATTNVLLVAVLAGADPGDPIDGVPTTAVGVGGAQGEQVVPGPTTSVAGGLLVCAFGCYGPGATYTGLIGVDPVVGGLATLRRGSSNATLLAIQALLLPGDLGPRAAALSTPGDQGWAGLVFAVRAALPTIAKTGTVVAATPRGAGASAVVLTVVRRNQAANPSAALDLTGWLGVGARVRVTGLVGPPRTTGAEVGVEAAWSGSLGCPALGAAPGQAWSGIGWVRTSTARTVRVALTCYQGDAFVTAAAAIQVGTGAGTWTPYSLTSTLPGGTYDRVAFQVDVTDGGPAGTLGLAAVRLEQVSDPALEYADGDTPSWAWDGAPGASTSTQLGQLSHLRTGGAVAGATARGARSMLGTQGAPVLIALYASGVIAGSGGHTFAEFVPASGEILVVKFGNIGYHNPIPSPPYAQGVAGFRELEQVSASQYTAGSGLYPSDTLYPADDLYPQAEVPAVAHSDALVWVSQVDVNPVPTLVHCSISSGSGPHEWVLERWASARVNAVPATNATKTSAGAPLVTLTSTTAKSALSVLVVDMAGSLGAPTYRGAVGQAFADQNASFGLYAYAQATTTAGAYPVGMTFPSGQVASVAAFEIVPATVITYAKAGTVAASAAGASPRQVDDARTAKAGLAAAAWVAAGERTDLPPTVFDKFGTGLVGD